MTKTGGAARPPIAADPDSLLNHYRRLVRLRQSEPALARGDARSLETGRFGFGCDKKERDQVPLSASTILRARASSVSRP